MNRSVFRATRVFLRGLKQSSVFSVRSDIDLFNSKKKEYLFGHNFSSIDEIAQSHEPNPESNTSDLHARLNELHLKVAEDSRLEGMDPNSADYKYTFQQIVRQEQEKFMNETKKRFEFNERLKGVGIGFALLFLAIGGHQVFMNYEYLKNSLLHGYWYDIEDKVEPQPNRKSQKYAVEKLQQQLTDKFVSGLKSSETPGVYLFGAFNQSRFPSRVPFFDGMKVDDVSVAKDYAVVISNGNLYQLTPQMESPQVMKMPFKASKCFISKNFVYFLTTKGKVAYTSRVDREYSIEPKSTRSWLGFSVKNNFGYLSFEFASGEYISDVSFGKLHLLALTNKSRLYVGVTEKASNYGQYGLPSNSPFVKDSTNLEVFETKEMPLLNNEVVYNKKQPSLQARKFTSIACGDYHSLALDTSGNIWTWGSNSNGQCGTETSYRSELQPIPAPVSISKSILKGGKIAKVFADGSTSFAQVISEENVRLLAFGDGLKGQLGINRFMHISSVPQSVKVVGTLTEYDESTDELVGIGIKDVSVGSSHVFVTLDNVGDKKDVLVFGDNEYGQLGNGKKIRSSKPITLPLLIEPEELQGDKKLKTEELALRIGDINTKRLQLHGNQVIKAGDESSVIYYQR